MLLEAGRGSLNLGPPGGLQGSPGPLPSPCLLPRIPLLGSQEKHQRQRWRRGEGFICSKVRGRAEDTDVQVPANEGKGCRNATRFGEALSFRHELLLCSRLITRIGQRYPQLTAGGSESPLRTLLFCIPSSHLHIQEIS